MINTEGLASRINAEVRRRTVGPELPDGEDAPQALLITAVKSLDAQTRTRTDFVDKWVEEQAREIVSQMAEVAREKAKPKPVHMDLGGENPVEIVHGHAKAGKRKEGPGA